MPIYKKFVLTVINALDDEKAIGAMRDYMRKAPDKYPNEMLTNDFLKPFLEKIKRHHKPIDEFLNTGIGRYLMNIDSIITDDILKRMVALDIPCLQVHDSFIVPEQYEEQLIDVMMSEYEKMFGFKPVIG